MYHLLIKSWHCPASAWIIYFNNKLTYSIFYSLSYISRCSPVTIKGIFHTTSQNAKIYKNNAGGQSLVSTSPFPRYIFFCEVFFFFFFFFSFSLSFPFFSLPFLPPFSFLSLFPYDTERSKFWPVVYEKAETLLCQQRSV